MLPQPLLPRTAALPAGPCAGRGRCSFAPRRLSPSSGCLGSLPAAMQTSGVVYHEGGLEMEAYVAWEPLAEEGRLLPGVLVAHTAIGPQEDFIRSKVDALAKMGYVGFALDAFGAGECVLGEEKDRANAVLRKDRGLGLRRVQAAKSALAAMEHVDPDQIVAIGYCLGGKLVLDLARSGDSAVKGVVSFHGILDSPQLEAAVPTISSKILCYHGGRDPFVPDSELVAFKLEMEERAAQYELVVFGGCYHAFTRPEKTSPEDRAAGFFYDESATDKSWKGALAFLEDVLQK